MRWRGFREDCTIPIKALPQDSRASQGVKQLVRAVELSPGSIALGLGHVSQLCLMQLDPYERGLCGGCRDGRLRGMIKRIESSVRR